MPALGGGAGLTVECRNCGAVIPVRPSRVERTKYCSRRCEKAARPKACLLKITLFLERMSGREGCWEWDGANDGKYGYGQLGSDNNRVLVHRAVWEIANNQPVPDGLWVLHNCDNPPCCNPGHLYAGTPADNAADRMRRNRHKSCPGQLNGTALLTNEQVRKIKLHQRPFTKILINALADRYGVRPRTISAILYNENWASI